MTDFSRMWIGGEWVAGESGTHPVRNPTDGSLIAEVPKAGVEQSRAAIAAARKAQPAWGAMSPLRGGRPDEAPVGPMPWNG